MRVEEGLKGEVKVRSRRGVEWLKENGGICVLGFWGFCLNGEGGSGARVQTGNGFWTSGLGVGFGSGDGGFGGLMRRLGPKIVGW